MQSGTLKKFDSCGFSLVEMAIVLFIVALLLGGLVPTLSGQIEQKRAGDTQRLLDQVRDSLLGFAIANGRLPCPASPISNGAESFAAGKSAADGDCSNFFNGFVPAATLGLTPVDNQGYLLDAWNNRVRYAVANNTVNGSDNAFSRTDGMKDATMDEISDADLLYVCASATGISGSDCGTALTLASSAPALIYSTGRNGATGGAGLDENANLDSNRVFVSHEPRPDYDDQMIWISPNILFNRMVAAGKLP